MFNQPFDSRTVEILLKSAGKIDLEDVQLTISDINGDALNLSQSQSVKLVPINLRWKRCIQIHLIPALKLVLACPWMTM